MGLSSSAQISMAFEEMGDLIENYDGHRRNKDPKSVSEVSKKSFTKDQKSQTLDLMS